MFNKRKREIEELKLAVKSLTYKTSSLERVMQNYIPGEITYKVITTRNWVELDISGYYKETISRYIYKDGREYSCPLALHDPNFSETGSANVIRIVDKYYKSLYGNVQEEYTLDLDTGKYMLMRKEVN
ncbi:MAG: hypothetical protein [Bacteriophage sp.]|nr:MAG: hypothetical protein [Bacteriophage sp.]